MGVLAFNFDVVRFFVSSTAQVAQGGNPYSLLEDMAPQVERWGQGSFANQLEPLLQLVRREDGGFPTRMEWAQALQQTGQNLCAVVSGVERRLLESAQAQLKTVVERRRSPSSSGVFARVANTNSYLDEEPDGEQLREAILISVGGSVLTANNTLAALAMTIEEARLQPREVLESRIGKNTIGEMWQSIEEQSHAATTLVRELKSRIDSMHLVTTDKSQDMRALLLSGGHLERIFGKLAKVRLLLGQFQNRISMAARGSAFQEACWRLNQHAGNCVDLTKLTASLFKGLIEIQRLYEEPQTSSSVALHAYLRTSVLQAVLGKDISLQMNLADDPWEILGPSKAVWQAIINLASNARQSVADFGRVEVSTRKLSLSTESAEEVRHHYFSAEPRAGDYMVLTVHDSGPGMKSLDLPSLFDLYENGYGMAFMRRVIEDMGGFIGVDTTTDGKNRGTTFSIYFPRAT